MIRVCVIPAHRGGHYESESGAGDEEPGDQRSARSFGQTIYSVCSTWFNIISSVYILYTVYVVPGLTLYPQLTLVCRCEEIKQNVYLCICAHLYVSGCSII